MKKHATIHAQKIPVDPGFITVNVFACCHRIDVFGYLYRSVAYDCINA